ncbi:PepSY domain-containing protein [Lacticaseibacillus mingshuiensis]|uniref:PepSY domain-containing protein n=1 Tax=Lacticaseibacillus mingshuiensis TaxID=2799574 RepID=A0ABW4CL65_9LACO|nr:PepSY domain-containing protein [Lacticaseibacillus mingshuiensis]
MKKIAILTLVALCLVATGCQQSTTKTHPATTTSSAAPTSVDAAAPDVTLHEAWTTLLRQHGEIAVTQVKLADGHYTLIGQDASREIELTIDATSGKVLKTASEEITEDELDDDRDAVIERQNLLTQSKAVAAATPHATGKLTSWEIEEDSGRMVWELQFKDGNKETEVQLDAYNGTVLGVDEDEDD